MALAFNAKSTAEEVASHFAHNIRGRTFIVTGPTLGGLGAETARVLAKFQPRLVVLAGRSKSKLDETAAAIRKETPDAPLKNLVLDLSSLKQVREAAAQASELPGPIDVIINNAAVMACPYSTTVDGHETQFGTNHLGHFLFTGLLLPKLLASESSRVVNVSSVGHRSSGVLFDDPAFSEGETYKKWTAYGQAKTANILFSVGLAKRFGGRGLTSFSLDPGGIATNLQKHFTKEDTDSIRRNHPEIFDEDGKMKPDAPGMKSVGGGASTQVRAALDPSLSADNGGYLVDCQLANDTAAPYALDEVNADKLWELSEKLVGEHFD